MSAEAKGPVVARESAELEFAAWCASMRLTRKLDESTLNDADKASLLATKKLIIDAIEDGFLARNEQGLFVFTTGDGKHVTFKKPTGATLMAIDNAKADAGVHRTMKFLAEMTGEAPVVFSKMDLVDVQVCDAIAGLFLAK
jgi:hypothetical protein